MPVILKVSQLNRYVKFQIEADPKLREIYVAGEIASITVNQRSGHMYFSLRDEQSSVRAVMFAKNTEFLRFMPQVGMAVIARGTATLYDRDGSFQMTVSELMPDGASTLGHAYEKQKKLLEAKGYFNEQHKRKLPAHPAVIGVATSESGAVLHDIISVIERRDASIKIIIAAATVQGKDAPDSVAKAIEALNTDGRSDIIIVARGGGSAEDLWSFNDEKIVKAVFESDIPVISAIGHETDVTLCDLAADVRAATPTAAAELAVSDSKITLTRLASLRELLDIRVRECIAEKERSLLKFKTAEPLCDAEFFINKNRQRLNNLILLLYNHSKQSLDMHQNEISKRAAILESLSPLKVLARGYSIASVGGKAIVSADQIKSGDELDIRFHSGTATAVVKKTEMGWNNDF